VINAPDRNLFTPLVPKLVFVVSGSRGLGSARANADGSVMWTWEIGPNTGAGTLLATIVYGADTLRRGFTIR